MTLLEDIYYGNINLGQRHYEHNSNFGQHHRIMVQNETKLIEILNTLPQAELGLETLSKLQDAQNEIKDFMEVDCFLEGFRMGANMMLETFLIPQKSVVKDMNE